jgi:hypothetical protein
MTISLNYSTTPGELSARFGVCSALEKLSM